MTTPLRVGWIGLGAMGLPMATRLLGVGHALRVCGHRSTQSLDAVRRAGAIALGTPLAVAQASEVVVTMVRDEAQTDAVVHGPDGVLAGLAAGSTLVVMSTLSPDYCRVLGARCAEVGAGFLDAPVSGGSPGAAAGSLSIMVGGDDALFETWRHLLDHLGDRIFHLGGVGAGQQAKIVNNAIKIGILGLTTEGLALGVRAGLDLDALLAVLKVSSASSHVVEQWDYYYEFKRDHRPGGPLEMLHKDIGFAVDLADALGVDVPLIRSAADVDVGRLLDHDRSPI